MNELQVHELFRQIMHIGNTFSPSLNPPRIVRKLSTDELEELFSSFEYKRFKRICPNLAQGIEEFYSTRDKQSKRTANSKCNRTEVSESAV